MKLNIASSLLVTAVTTITSNAADDTIYFRVYFNDTCSTNIHGNSTRNAVPRLATDTDTCSVIAYTDPNGVYKENAENLFNCCENFVEFVQYAGTNVCGDPNQGKWIYNVMSVECDYVETSLGDTWQQMVDYTRCSKRHNYNGLYCSTITEEQCNDPNFIPVGGSWVIVNREEPSNNEDQETSSPSEDSGSKSMPSDDSGSKGNMPSVMMVFLVLSLSCLHILP